MKTWFRQLPQRDQIALLLLAGALSLWLVYQALLMPAKTQRERLLATNDAAAQLLGRVDTKVSQLMYLREQGGSRRSQNITATINSTTRALGIAVQRMQPNSRGEVQIRMEDVDYDLLVRWLHRIEVVEGLLIVEASIAQSGRSGSVNASIRIAQS
ncbi:hypothetical protein NOR51B_2275 [Luminiphilus syltensis NOR5-1B]|uniref:General secretion pathway protein M n=1 Tax=Luminiphilus syltensis NOR5-1B TaxID=565045 RepID=B8KQL9_9GAMM|nr:type II secretion system protein GspM [Luminiphilus syltensis]EED36325.1 hypothetical protein NOR51B_2275 [Luminiphilus syltensis NOR5-1B]